MTDSIIKRKNTQDPFLMKTRLDKVKDLNKLATLVKNPFKELDLDSFFSKDVFDSIFIPKVKKYKKFTKY